MKSFLHVLVILATVGVFVADTLLLGVPAFRNGWWTLSFFAFPAALLALAWGGEGKKGLRIAAWLVFLAGLGGWIGLRNVGRSPARRPSRSANALPISCSRTRTARICA